MWQNVQQKHPSTLGSIRLIMFRRLGVLVETIAITGAFLTLWLVGTYSDSYSRGSNAAESARSSTWMSELLENNDSNVFHWECHVQPKLWYWFAFLWYLWIHDEMLHLCFHVFFPLDDEDSIILQTKIQVADAEAWTAMPVPPMRRSKVWPMRKPLRNLALWFQVVRWSGVRIIDSMVPDILLIVEFW